MKSLMGSIQEEKIKPLVDTTKFEVRIHRQNLRGCSIRWTSGAWLDCACARMLCVCARLDSTKLANAHISCISVFHKETMCCSGRRMEK